MLPPREGEAVGRGRRFPRAHTTDQPPRGGSAGTGCVVLTLTLRGEIEYGDKNIAAKRMQEKNPENSGTGRRDPSISRSAAPTTRSRCPRRTDCNDRG